MKKRVFKFIASALTVGLLVGCTGNSVLPAIEEEVEIPIEAETIPSGSSTLDQIRDLINPDDIIADKAEEDIQKENVDTDEEKDNEEVKENTRKTAEEGTPFELHGKLSVSETKIVDANGNDFQLCGVSTHGLGWFPEYVNKESFLSLRDDFGANVVRLALYTDEGAGYCTGGDRTMLKNTVINGVDYATELGMYVIIDWHVLHDLDPNLYKSDSLAFFEEMSKKYAANENVIYEICNEPNGGTTWAQIKSYALEVIPVIRANDPDAIIIVGTPTWSQDVEQAAADPITGYDNIMYAVHFYADTHKDWLRDKIQVALNAKIPVFISEFGICDASGNGNINVPEANAWIEYLDKNGISFVSWNLSNKNESSSLIYYTCNKTSGWTYDELSDSGKWLVGVLDTHSDHGSLLMDGKTADTSTVGASSGSGISTEKTNTSAPAATGENGNLKVSVAATNSWSEGSSICTQYTVTLKNDGTANVSGWSLDITFDKDITISQIWCTKGTTNGNVLTLTPESYNSEIGAGKTTSDVGFIIKSDGALASPSVNVR